MQKSCFDFLSFLFSSKAVVYVTCICNHQNVLGRTALRVMDLNCILCLEYIVVYVLVYQSNFCSELVIKVQICLA